MKKGYKSANVQGLKQETHGEGRRREEERKENNLFTQGDYIERDMTTRLHMEVF